MRDETAKLPWGTETAAKLSNAIDLAEKDIPDADAVPQLGTGKTAERALAVGLFCVLRYEDNFSEAVRAAANHGGDSSVTASVAGQIAGACIGREAIPAELTEKLELSAMINDYGMQIGSLRGCL